jgi:serine protease Do
VTKYKLSVKVKTVKFQFRSLIQRAKKSEHRLKGTILFIALFLSYVPLYAEDDMVRKVATDISPWLVRIDTIGGHEKVGSEFANEGTSTGLLLDRNGFVVTSAFNFLHDPTSILLRFADGSKRVAQKIVTDQNRMLTLLKVENLDPAFLPELYTVAPKDSIRIGEICIAVGTALSDAEPNIATGIISGKNRIWGKAIQTDTAVGPNNYGGPLLDLEGRVLAILVPLSMQSASLTAGAETYDGGVGLAVPMEDVQRFLPKLKEGKDLVPGVLGIEFKENRLFIGEAIIDVVIPDLPAAQAGLKQGDKIVVLDGKPITSALELSMNLRSRYADEEIRLVFQRSNTEKEVVLKTIAPPKEPKE